MADPLDRKRALAKLLEIGNGYWVGKDFRYIDSIIPPGVLGERK